MFRFRQCCGARVAFNDPVETDMTAKTLTIATMIAFLAACGPAAAGLTATFGGLRAAVIDTGVRPSRSSERQISPAAPTDVTPPIDVFDV